MVNIFHILVMFNCSLLSKICLTYIPNIVPPRHLPRSPLVSPGLPQSPSQWPLVTPFWIWCKWKKRGKLAWFSNCPALFLTHSQFSWPNFFTCLHTLMHTGFWLGGLWAFTKISKNIPFYISQNITFVHFLPNYGFAYTKWPIIRAGSSLGLAR